VIETMAPSELFRHLVWYARYAKSCHRDHTLSVLLSRSDVVVFTRSPGQLMSKLRSEQERLLLTASVDSHMLCVSLGTDRFRAGITG
jgi:hypothetical protein